MLWNAQLYRAVAEAPKELNKTRGIGNIEAPPDFVASVIADDYETWDSTIKELKILKSERDTATGALVEVIWSRYCLRESPSHSQCPSLTGLISFRRLLLVHTNMPAHPLTSLKFLQQHPYLLRNF